MTRRGAGISFRFHATRFVLLPGEGLLGVCLVVDLPALSALFWAQQQMLEKPADGHDMPYLMLRTVLFD